MVTLDELLNDYFLSDGEIRSFEFDYSSKILKLQLRIRKSISKKAFEQTIAQFEFGSVKAIDVFEDFPTNGRCTDVKLIAIGDREFYLALDPFNNTDEPHEQDNWIIKAKSLTFTDENGIRTEISPLARL